MSSLATGFTVTLHGAAGRMGRELFDAIQEQPDITVVSMWEGSQHPRLGEDIYHSGVSLTRPFESSAGDVVVDFSLPEGLGRLVDNWPDAGSALLSGTTGLSPHEQAALNRLAERIPVFYAANMSLGIQLLKILTATATRMVGANWDVELLERHHSRKADAPSGTALELANTVRANCTRPLSTVFGREGRSALRNRDEMGIFALRGGGIVGEHELLFAGPAETVRISHQVQSRKVFADGALHAARWLCRQKPGRYGMDELFAETQP
jgi:4-hydroxy-tetrahydrodipicolinate reductase